MERPGRNAPCPCGSGKKFKQCHASKKDGMSPALMAALVLVAVLAVIVIIVNVRRASNSGLVWSSEHGHYHDASGREVSR